MNETLAQRFKELIESEGYQPRAYSGRGMYDKECLGYSASNAITSTAEIVSGAYIIRDEELVNYVIDAFRNVETDQLGRGTIIYFRYVEWVNDEENEENEDEI